MIPDILSDLRPSTIPVEAVPHRYEHPITLGRKPHMKKEKLAIQGRMLFNQVLYHGLHLRLHTGDGRYVRECESFKGRELSLLPCTDDAKSRRERYG
jgi:hypothetical protein